MTELLLHSLIHLEPVVSRLVRNAVDAISNPNERFLRPIRVLEIGIGEYSQTLFKLCEELQAELTSVDPKPRFRHAGTKETTSAEVLRFPSPVTLDSNMRWDRSADLIADLKEAHAEYERRKTIVPVPPYDVAIIDGDHNYYTVYHELFSIFRANPSAVAIMHDVGWPCARRDMYYDPKQIPASYLHPHSFDFGAAPGHARLVPWGFRGEGAFALAEHEGGPQNGVLTAIEDFISAWNRAFGFKLHPPLRAKTIPSVFGLAVVEPDIEGMSALRIENVDLIPLLERLEQNRLELYAAVLARDYSRRR